MTVFPSQWIKWLRSVRAAHINFQIGKIQVSEKTIRAGQKKIYANWIFAGFLVHFVKLPSYLGSDFCLKPVFSVQWIYLDCLAFLLYRIPWRFISSNSEMCPGVRSEKFCLWPRFKLFKNAAACCGCPHKVSLFPVSRPILHLFSQTRVAKYLEIWLKYLRILLVAAF